MINVKKVYCLNEIGGREQNEDAVWPVKGAYSQDERLFMVCDGVGGNSYGEVASALTCEGFASYFQQHLPKGGTPDCAFVQGARSYVMQQFGRHIAAKPGAGNMSTTLTMAYVADNSVVVAWCGDSRIYQIRNGEVVFQSEDHSLVNELVRRGELSREEAKSHPQKNVILRAIQYKENISPIDCVELTDVREGDYFLLCSDGLLENIGEQELHYLLIEVPAHRILDEVQRLCKGKTRDNYSMYLLQLSGVPERKPVATPTRGRRMVPVTLLSVIGLALIMAISWFIVNLGSSKDNVLPKQANDHVRVRDRQVEVRGASVGSGLKEVINALDSDNQHISKKEEKGVKEEKGSAAKKADAANPIRNTIERVNDEIKQEKGIAGQNTTGVAAEKPAQKLPENDAVDHTEIKKDQTSGIEEVKATLENGEKKQRANEDKTEKASTKNEVGNKDSAGQQKPKSEIPKGTPSQKPKSKNSSTLRRS